MEDNDHIYGVIRGSAISHGGYTPSVTAPSVDGEMKVLIDAWKDADITPDTLSYIEAHGTGTKMGDPVEINALKKAFRSHTDKSRFCAIGSAKAHIGHTEGAAGIAGIIKTLLSFQHETIPAMPRYEKLNPYIQLEDSPFYINTRPEKWEALYDENREALPRRAGVSSFGFGGAYAHVVLEEYEAGDRMAEVREPNPNEPCVFVLSAKNEERLRAYAERMADFLEKAGSSRPVTDTSEEILSENLEKDLAGFACDILKVRESDIDYEGNLVEHGFEPVSQTEFCRRVNEKYGLETDSQIFAECSSISSFAHYLTDEHKEKLTRHYPESPQKILPEDRMSDFNLSDIAYTSQVGREAMKERLALTVSSVGELRDKLGSFVAGEDDIEDLYRGSVRLNKDTLSVFEADEDMGKTVDSWIAKGKYAKLLGLWVRGLVLDWNKLYGEVKPKRVSLPTYPFAKERYWIEGSGSGDKGSGVGEYAAKLHPLLHQNTSDLSEQRFSSIFTGDEFFLADHMFQGKRILPGVAYLEMARAAAERAAGVSGNGHTGILLRNVVWAKPIVVEDDPVSVHIGLFPEESGEIAYEIYSQSEPKSGEEDAEPVVHSQGTAVLISVDEVPALDIESLKAECDRKRLASDDCYEAFAEAGLEYGAGHRGIERIYVGEGRALAKLALPSSVSDTADKFVLHPSLTDSALQASMGLMLGSGRLEPALPFALERTEIFSGCTSSMWAFVRNGEGDDPENRVSKLDIDLCDEDGRVCVRMRKFASRAQGSAAEPTGVLMFRPSWREEAADAEGRPTDYERHLVVLCEPDEALRKNIGGGIKGTEFVILESEEKSADTRFSAYALRLFEDIRAILKAKPKEKFLLQVLISAKEDQRLFSGFSGLLRTAHSENPKFTGQLIETDKNIRWCCRNGDIQIFYSCNISMMSIIMSPLLQHYQIFRFRPCLKRAADIRTTYI